MIRVCGGVVGLGLIVFGATPAGAADDTRAGDAMIDAYLQKQADTIHASFMEGIATPEDWAQNRAALQREYMTMLGLWPLPEKSDLHATVTGTLTRDGYVVEKVHFQSRPRLYVTGNLYRPADVPPGKRLPAVLYVLGHTRLGKTTYQPHGIWFAKHGYVCLLVDTIGQGEVPGIHRGTYSEGRDWWWSRGYTPAGVECYNGMRAIDYLQSRLDVDPERIAVTGISGGGATTLWVAAADARVKAAVAVSGIADLPAYVSEKRVNVHCDCMFLYNVFRWPWAQIPALIAPRPLMIINSTDDRFFPLDAHQRVMNRLERIYALYGAGDQLASVVSVGEHSYRQDIRRAAYRFINIHLKGDPSTVTDSERDLLEHEGNRVVAPAPHETLSVFEGELPDDALNPEIDKHFVAMVDVPAPQAGQFEQWRATLLAELRRLTFRALPARVAPAEVVREETDERWCLSAEEGIHFYLSRAAREGDAGDGVGQKTGAQRVVLVVANPEAPGESERPILPESLDALIGPANAVYLCQPRGVGPTRWTQDSPPNYVGRAHALVGRTVDDGRVWDVAAAARFLQARLDPPEGVHVAGSGHGAVVAAYAALFEPAIAGAVLVEPPATHMEPTAPQFLNVLRVCDIPDVLGMLAPRELTLSVRESERFEKVRGIYAAAGAPQRVGVR